MLLTVKRIFFLLYLSLSISAYSQNSLCGTDYIREKILQQHPEIISRENQYEKAIREQLKKTAVGINGTTYVIPVVFHILHENGIENISNAQICDAVALLNEDFGKKNADTIYTVSNFKPIAANAEIEFRLATKDPNGNPTTGIDRIYSPLTHNATDSSKLNQWPPSQYLNVWVVDSLAKINGISGVQGYAYFPSYASMYPKLDGVLIRHDCAGRFGSGGPYQKAFARIFTHEVGHYLNLFHTWGYNFDVGLHCTGDDLVADTPPTAGGLGCNNLLLSTCGSLDNVQNYMDYSYCYTMFTRGQASRMTATLNTSVAGRNNLWTPGNLILTGTDSVSPCTSTGILESEQNTGYLLASPNPFSSQTILHGETIFKNVTLTIYNSCGEQVKQIKNISGQTITLHRDNLPSGLYFIRLIEDNQTFTTGKLVITEN